MIGKAVFFLIAQGALSQIKIYYPTLHVGMARRRGGPLALLLLLLVACAAIADQDTHCEATGGGSCTNTGGVSCRRTHLNECPPVETSRDPFPSNCSNEPCRVAAFNETVDIEGRKVGDISLSLVGAEGHTDFFDLTVSWEHTDANPDIEGYQVRVYFRSLHDADSTINPLICVCISDAATRSFTFRDIGLIYVSNRWLQVQVGTYPVEFTSAESIGYFFRSASPTRPSCVSNHGAHNCQSWPSSCLELPRRAGSCNPPVYNPANFRTHTLLLPNDTMSVNVTWDEPTPVLPAFHPNDSSVPSPSTFYVVLRERLTSYREYFLVEDNPTNSVFITPLNSSRNFTMEVGSYMYCSGFNPGSFDTPGFQGCSNANAVGIPEPTTSPPPTMTTHSFHTFPTTTPTTPTPIRDAGPQNIVSIAAPVAAAVLVVLLVITVVAIMVAVIVNKRRKTYYTGGKSTSNGTYSANDYNCPGPILSEPFPKRRAYIIQSSRSEDFYKNITNDRFMPSLNECGIECDGTDWTLYGSPSTNVERGVREADAILCICDRALKEEWDNPGKAGPEVNCLKLIIQRRVENHGNLDMLAFIILCESHREFIPTGEYVDVIRKFNMSQTIDIVLFIQQTPRCVNGPLRSETSSDESVENDRSSIDTSSDATNSTVVSPEGAQADRCLRDLLPSLEPHIPPSHPHNPPSHPHNSPSHT